jgi:hypothetical protein
MTPTEALKAGAALMMRTPAAVATWYLATQGATERLKAKESAVKAGASAQEGVGARDAVEQPERVEAALGITRLDRSRDDRKEPGLTTRTLESIEADEAATSARDVGQANVEETRSMVETLQDAGKEEELLELQSEREEPQQQPQQQQ